MSYSPFIARRARKRRDDMRRRTIGSWGIGAALVLATALTARSEPAATGSFTIDFSGFPPNVTWTGDLAFDPGTFMVGGSTVDLGSAVGTMTHSGVATVSIPTLSATYTLSATDTVLGFSGSGVAACETGTCVNGSASFVTMLNTIDDPTVLLPGGYAYTFDGTIFIDFLGNGPGGVFGLNAFLPQSTPAGSSVPVSVDTTFFDSRRDALRDLLVDVVFDTVTSGGTTTIFGISAAPGALPAGITLDPTASITIDVVTDASFTGPVTVCVGYEDMDGDDVVDGTSITVDRLRLLHGLVVGQPLVDVTTSSGGGQVCGEVLSLSPFVVGVAPEVTTTTTSTTTTSITTSTIDGSSTTTTTIVTTTTTTTTTLPMLECDTALECLDAAQLFTICPGQEIPKKMPKVFVKKTRKARRILDKIARAKTAKKGEKLLAKAIKNVETVGTKAEKLSMKSKNPLPGICLAEIENLLQPILEALAARNLGVPFPTGGGSCGSGRAMRATIGGAAWSVGSNGSVSHETIGLPYLTVSGCKDPVPPDGSCSEVLYLSFLYDGSGPQTMECGLLGSTFVEYITSVDGGIQNAFYFSRSCTITVDGDPNGQITGTFSASLTDGNLPIETVLEVTGGCFSSRPF